MKVIGLDGREYSLDHTKYPIKKYTGSQPKQRVGDAIVTAFPGTFIAEELPCLGAGKLRLDFYIHRFNVAIEVDGDQHDTFNEFFHGTRAAFAQSKRRDRDKEEWCRSNGIKMIRIHSAIAMDDHVDLISTIKNKIRKL